jgi:ribosomal-protein-alanine N-acetyltransferase
VTASPGASQAGARLRNLVPADLSGVIALEHELFPEDPWSDEMFADELAQPPGHRLYVLAEANPDPDPDQSPNPDQSPDPDANPDNNPGPALAGYAGMLFVPGGTQAEVMTIGVRPAYWGHGIGAALLDTLLAAARDRGCTEVYLEVRADNPRAQGLYQRRGFTEVGVRRGYYQPSGMDAIVMMKELGDTRRAR